MTLITQTEAGTSVYQKEYIYIITLCVSQVQKPGVSGNPQV